MADNKNKVMHHENDVNEWEKADELADKIALALEGDSFINAYIAASIRLREAARLVGFTAEALKIFNSTFFNLCVTKEQRDAKKTSVSKKNVLANQIDVVDVADKIAEQCRPYDSKIALFALSEIIVYSISRGQFSNRDLKILDELVLEVEENIYSVMAMDNKMMEGKN